MSEIGDLILTSEAARELRVSPDTIRLWSDAGKLPEAYRTRGGVRLFRLAEVQRFARELEAKRNAG